MATTALTIPTDAALTEHADAIRRLGKQCIVEIGRRLSECRRIIKERGESWSDWLEREFEWSDQQARRFIHVYKQLSGLNKLLSEDFPVSALYLLAAPSTPAEARSEIAERAQAGERISGAKVKQAIETAKGRQQPAKRKPRNRREREDVGNHVKENGPAPEEASTKKVAHRAEALFGFFFRVFGRLDAAEQRDFIRRLPTEMLAYRDDIALDSAGENARLRARVEELEVEKRRLEAKITRLESEIEELRRPTSEVVNGEAVDVDAAMLGNLLKTHDRASEAVRQRFMTRVGYVRDGAFPPFLDRRTREARP
jgi:hypothetical protein